MSRQSDIEDRCRDALRDVSDPELPINLVDLGLIYDITADNGHVEVEMTLTAMGCPAADMMKADVRNHLIETVTGVDSVDVDIVWEPVWTKEKISEEGRQKLQSFGIGV